MLSRLHTLSPQLDSAFRHADDAAKHDAVLGACQYVADKLPRREEIINIGLDFLRGKTEGRDELIRKLQKFSEEKDEEYFLLNEQQSEEARSRALMLFSEARVASAILMAISNGAGALDDAIYEAAMSMDDSDVLIPRLQAILQPAG
ncbi:hypothetical protein [Ideonella sp.]|uniref:hypothetical protein n=1 Tax=Ideonella sp. TaxID=1929293 RepID=UPI0035B00C11